MRIGLLLLSTTTVGFAFAACGGGQKDVAPVNAPVPSGSASASAAFATTPPPSGLPPMAAMPPPGVAGSKKGKTKPVANAFACASDKTSAKDPGDLVKKNGEACAAPLKMHVVGAPLRGTEADKDAQQDHKQHVDANKCYRVYFAGDEGVRDIVAIARDSNGDVVAQSGGTALPQDGAMCFTAADDVTLSIAIGAGKGAYVAQWWSD